MKTERLPAGMVKLTAGDGATAIIPARAGSKVMDFARLHGEDPEQALLALRGEAPTPKTPVLTLRDMLGSHQTFTEPLEQWPALMGTFMGYASWETDDLAVLDLDWHLGGRMQAEALATFASPKPAYLANTQRGVHFLFMGPAAAERAALSALSLVAVGLLDGASGVELLQRCRCHPWEVWGEMTGELPWVSSVPTGFGDGDQWLAERGLEPGKRYPHSQCPFQPTPGPDTNPSVVVGDKQVYCYRCQRGAPIAVLARGAPAWSLADLVRRGCWQDQAVLILSAMYGWLLSEQVITAAWRGAVRQLVDEEEQGRYLWPTGLYQTVGGNWVGVETNKLVPSRTLGNQAVLANLPFLWTQGGTKKGEPVVWLDTAAPVPGIPPVRVYRRQTVRWQFQNPPFVFYSQLAKSKPMPVAEAWAVVEDHFPGIERPLVELLLGAVGCCEPAPGQPPLLAVFGTSGGGKTTTTKFVCGMLGAELAILPRESGAIWREALATAAANQPGILLGDEFLREGVLKPAQLLEVQSPVAGRICYVGPVNVPLSAPLVLTGPHIPDSWYGDQQVARRVYIYRVRGRVNWEEANHYDLASNWRQDPLRAQAADAIVRDVAARWWADRISCWHEVATHYGATPLEQQQDEDLRGRLVALLLELADSCAVTNGWLLVPPNHARYYDLLKQRENLFAVSLGAYVHLRMEGSAVKLKLSEGQSLPRGANNSYPVAQWKNILQ